MLGPLLYASIVYLFQILASHAQLVQSMLNTPPDAEALRMFLTLPLYHEFMNPRQYELLHIPFATALLNLRTEAAKILGTEQSTGFILEKL